MKTLSIVAVAVMLSLALAPAVDAQGFTQILEVKVKQGYIQAYEDFVKKLIEGHDKAKSPSLWVGYSVVMGKPGGTYRFVRNFEKWADLDNRMGNMEALTVAFGEKEAQRILTEGRRATESVFDRTYRYLPEATANAPEGGSQAKFYDVTIRTVRRDMSPEYWIVLGKYKEGYEASPRKPIVYRSVLVHGPSDGTVFFRSVPFNTWAERDEFGANQLLADYFGADEWRSIGDTARKARMGAEHFVSQYRPDLSREPSESPTNEP
jgi:hypothetical protein